MIYKTGRFHSRKWFNMWFCMKGKKQRLTRVRRQLRMTGVTVEIWAGPARQPLNPPDWASATEAEGQLDLYTQQPTGCTSGMNQIDTSDQSAGAEFIAG